MSAKKRRDDEVKRTLTLALGLALTLAACAPAAPSAPAALVSNTPASATTAPASAPTLDPNENAAVKPIFFGFLTGCQVVDDSTVRFTTNAPFGPFPAVISLLSMVPPKYTADNGSKYLNENPVGTGPYKWVEWVKG